MPETKNHELPETFEISDVEIFASGKWNGDNYTDEDLENIARSFEETKPALKPYLKIGHDDNQLLAQRDGLPAVGWIERVKKIGNKLFADFCNVPKKVYDLIKAGAYKRISSEIFFNIKINDKTFPKALKAVSLLGADTPAVQNLDDIIAMYVVENKNISKAYTFENKKEGGNKMDELEKMRAEKEELEKKFEEAKSENETLKKENEEKAKEVEEAEKKVEEAKKEGEEAKAEVAKNKLEIKRKEIEAEVDKFISDPKSFALPVDKEILCKLMEHNELTEVKAYKIGDEEKTVNDMFKELLTRERVALNTENKSETGQTGNREDNAMLHEQALKYAKDNNVSYKEALIFVSK